MFHYLIRRDGRSRARRGAVNTRPMFIVRSVHTSPGGWGLARGLPEVLAQVRLVAEAAPQRNVAQGRIGRKHVLGGQFQAASHDERVR